MRRNLAMLFSLVIILSLLPTKPLDGIDNVDFFSDEGSFSDPPLISFDQDLGISIAGNTTISGFIVSASAPDTSTWQITRLSEDGASTNITNVIPMEIFPSLSNQDDGLSRWVWDFTIDPSSIPNCTCFVTVTVASNSLYSKISTIFFTGVSNVPALVLDNHVDITEQYSTYSEQIDISGWAYSQDGLPVRVYTMAINSENSANACSDFPSISSLDDLSGLDFDASSEYASFGYFTDYFDSSMLEDGWYSLWTFTSSFDNSSIIQSLCTVSKIDNSDPIAIIEGEISSVEGDGNLIFDAGSSYDYYWGKEDLNYVWTLIRMDASGDSLQETKEGREFSYFTVQDDVSGNFVLSLLVVDYQGNTDFTSIEFSIQNLDPVAKLIVSDNSLSDGDSYQLPDLAEWTLDASDSIDTTNDIDGLRCVWKINFKTIYEGCERKFSWPEGDSNNSLFLTLEVIDDDDDFSVITVELSRSDQTNELPIPIIVLLISILFFISSILYSRRSDDMQIPKWND